MDLVGDEDGVSSLQELCLQVVLTSHYWRVQRRQLEGLPEHAANRLLESLLAQGQVGPPQLELFQDCVTVLHLDGKDLAKQHRSWFFAACQFRYLHELHFHNFYKPPYLQDMHLTALAPLAACLQDLSLEGCSRFGSSAVAHVAALTLLTRLSLAGTEMMPIFSSLTSLDKLRILDLSNTPLEDKCCKGLSALSGLRTLLLESTRVTDEGAQALAALTCLETLDLSLTEVHFPPGITSLSRLHMAGCELGAALPPVGPDRRSLQELHLNSATIQGSRLLEGLLTASHLTKIVLRGMHLDYSDLHFLNAALHLQHLDMHGCVLKGHEGSDWLTMPALRHVDVGKDVLEEDGRAESVMTMLEASGAYEHMSYLDISRSSTARSETEGLFWRLLRWTRLEHLDFRGHRIAPDLEAASNRYGSTVAMTRLRTLLINDAPVSRKAASILAALAPALTSLAVRGISHELKLEGLEGLCGLRKLQSLDVWGDFYCSRCIMEGPLTTLTCLTHLALSEYSLVNSCEVLEHQSRAAVGQEEVFNWAVKSFPRLCSLQWVHLRAGGRRVEFVYKRDDGGAGRQGVAALSSLPEVLEYDERIKYNRSELRDMRRGAASPKDGLLQALSAPYGGGVSLTVGELILRDAAALVELD